MAYEVRMNYENYYSGVTTNALLYKKVFSDLKDAIKKFDSLRKQISDKDEWKKIRGRVKELDLAELQPKDFADGYCFFDKPITDDGAYLSSMVLNTAYGFDFEDIQVSIIDPETNEIVVRS